jgi:hypothetical protein
MRPFLIKERDKPMTLHFDLIKQHEAEALFVEPEPNDPRIQFQIDIEKLFHRNQLYPRIRAEFEEHSKLDFAKHMKDNHIDLEFGYGLLVQMCLHKRAHLPTLVGILRKHFDGDCRLTVQELEKAVQADLIDWSPVARQFVIRYDISADIQADLDRYQFPLPMVVPPRQLRTNEDTGYYTSHSSVILRDNHHDEDVCLDYLNQVNKTRFRINQEVAKTIKNRWRNLDKPKPDEEAGEYQKRVRAFEKYDRTTHDVLNHLGLANEGEFYLTHKFDKRGRTYCLGYHVSYMGAPWNKAVIEFADQEIVE